jgi:transposase
MDRAEGLVPERRVRRWRSVAEKRRIVELTLVPGASVALVARAHGVNANQVFKWRREFERGELSEPGFSIGALLPVVMSGGDKPQTTAGSIHVEFPGLSGDRGGLAEHRLSPMPCHPLISTAWDFLCCIALPALDPRNRRVRTRTHGGVTGKASDRIPMSIPQPAFGRKCFILLRHQCKAPHPPRNAYRNRLSMSALAMITGQWF